MQCVAAYLTAWVEAFQRVEPSLLANLDSDMPLRVCPSPCLLRPSTPIFLLVLGRHHHRRSRRQGRRSRPPLRHRAGLLCPPLTRFTPDGAWVLCARLSLVVVSPRASPPLTPKACPLAHVMRFSPYVCGVDHVANEPVKAFLHD
jgi:hypothetical protein